jgi:uncharacterized protein (TIGR02284 family)
MASIGGEKTVIDLLNELIELDYDAIEAYKAAVGRVQEFRDRGRIASFLEDHRRHVRELNALVRQLGGEPAGDGDLRQILTKSKVVIGALFGDRLVLEAMKANEAEASSLHERAATRGDLPTSVRAVLERHLADERRHHDWIVERLDAAEGLLRL